MHVLFSFVFMMQIWLVFSNWIVDGQMDFSSGSGSPSNSISSPGVSLPPGGLFGQAQQPANYPHLKGEDDPSEDITSMNEKMYEGIDCADLVEQLKDTDTLHEQADIIHYLYTTKYDDGILSPIFVTS